MELGSKGFAALVNDNLKIKGEDIKALAQGIRKLDDNDRKWLAERFVVEGYADVVVSKDLTGQEIVLHRRQV